MLRAFLVGLALVACGETSPVTAASADPEPPAAASPVDPEPPGAESPTSELTVAAGEPAEVVPEPAIAIDPAIHDPAARARARADVVTARWIAEGVREEHVRARTIGDAVVLVTIDDPERFVDGSEAEILGMLVAPDGELEVPAEVLARFTYPSTCTEIGVHRAELRIVGDPGDGIATIDGGSVAIAFTAIHGAIEAVRTVCEGTLELSPSFGGDVVICHDGFAHPVARIVGGAPVPAESPRDAFARLASDVEEAARTGADRARALLESYADDAIAADAGCEEPDASALASARRRIAEALSARGDGSEVVDGAVVGCLQPDGAFWMELYDEADRYRAVWWVGSTTVEEMLRQPEEFVTDEPLAVSVDLDDDDVPELVASVLGEDGVVASYCEDDLVAHTVVRGVAGTGSVRGVGSPFVGEGAAPRLACEGRVLRWRRGFLVPLERGDAEVRAASRLASDMREPYDAVFRTLLVSPSASPTATCDDPAAWPFRFRDALVSALLAEPEDAAALASRASGCAIPAST